MKNLKTRAIIAYGLSVLALGLVLAVPGSAWAAKRHHHHTQTQQTAQPTQQPCTIHFQTGCSGM